MKDIKLIADVYTKLLTEAPVYGDEPSFDPAEMARPGRVREGPRTMPLGYAIGAKATETGEDLVVLTTRIVDAIKQRVFSRENKIINGKTYNLYFAGTPEDFKVQVGNEIVRVLGLRPEGKNVHARDHAARQIINRILKVVQIPGGDAGQAPGIVAVAAPAAPLVVAAPEAVAAVAAVAEAPAPEPVVPKETYFSHTSKYTLNRDKFSDNLEDDVKSGYGALMRGGLGDGEFTGAEVIAELKKTFTSSVSRALINSLIKVGVIEEVEEAKANAEVPALDGPDEDYGDALSKAYRELKLDSGGNRTNRFMPEKTRAIGTAVYNEGTFSPMGVLQSAGQYLKGLSPIKRQREEASASRKTGDNANAEYNKFTQAMTSAGVPFKNITNDQLINWVEKNLTLLTVDSPVMTNLALTRADVAKDLPNLFMSIIQDRNACVYGTRKCSGGTSVPSVSGGPGPVSVSGGPGPVPGGKKGLSMTPENMARRAARVAKLRLAAAAPAPIGITEANFLALLKIRNFDQAMSANIVDLLKTKEVGVIFIPPPK